MKADGWKMKKRKEDPKPAAYRRLESDDEIEAGPAGVPKGCVPVLVGSEKRMERFVIPTKLFKHPCFVCLLEMAEREFGYNQPGILKIPCDVEYFQRVIAEIANSKAK